MSGPFLGLIGVGAVITAVVVLLKLAPAPVESPTSLASSVGVAEASAHRQAQGAPSSSGGGESAQARAAVDPAGASAPAGPPPKTPWGEPDLQGIWTNDYEVPLQRPAKYADKEFFTDEERAELDKVRAGIIGRDSRAARGSEQDVGGAYSAAIFLSHKHMGRRTSLVVDPPNGKIPALTEAAQKRTEARRAYLKEHPADSWLDRSPYDRCILGFNAGPPITPGGYNQNMQLFQTPDYLVIVTEMIHTARVVPLDGRPALGEGIRQWSGDSRGRWEGDTLVVETSNFSAQRQWRGSSEKMKLIERFTRVDADTLDYTFTVSDAETWTRPWTASIPMRRSDGPLYEYACHEGNYSLPNILSGTRAEEAKAAAPKQ